MAICIIYVSWPESFRLSLHLPFLFVDIWWIQRRLLITVVCLCRAVLAHLMRISRQMLIISAVLLVMIQKFVVVLCPICVLRCGLCDALGLLRTFGARMSWTSWFFQLHLLTRGARDLRVRPTTTLLQIQRF